MSTPSTTNVVKLGGPADIVSLVPWLVGFHPRDSLVMVCLYGPRNRTGLTLRVDLPTPEHHAAMATGLADRARRAGADAVILVCYTEAPDVEGDLPRAELVRQQLAACLEHGIGYLEALLVRDGRWFSYDCRKSCCPPEGTPLPERPSAAAARCAAEAALEGRALLRDREELERSVRGPVALRALALEQVYDRVLDSLRADVARSPRGVRERVLALAGERLAAYVDGRPELSDEDAATIVLGMGDHEVRDELGTWILDRPADALLAFLAELARRAPDSECPPICTVVAWAAYAHGNGGLANVALDRALRVDPGYRMALLIRQGLAGQVPPAQVREVTRETRRELEERRRGERWAAG